VLDGREGRALAGTFMELIESRPFFEEEIGRVDAESEKEPVHRIRPELERMM